MVIFAPVRVARLLLHAPMIDFVSHSRPAGNIRQPCEYINLDQRIKWADSYYFSDCSPTLMYVSLAIDQPGTMIITPSTDLFVLWWTEWRSTFVKKDQGIVAVQSLGLGRTFRWQSLCSERHEEGQRAKWLRTSWVWAPPREQIQRKNLPVTYNLWITGFFSSIYFG